MLHKILSYHAHRSVFLHFSLLSLLICYVRIMKSLCVIPYYIQVIEEPFPSEHFVKVTDRKPPSWAPTMEMKGSLSEVQCTSRCESQNGCVGFTVEKR